MTNGSDDYTPEEQQIAHQWRQLKAARAELRTEMATRERQVSRLAELCAKLNVARIVVDGIELDMAPHAFASAAMDEPAADDDVSDDDAAYGATGMRPIDLRKAMSGN